MPAASTAAKPTVQAHVQAALVLAEWGEDAESARALSRAGALADLAQDVSWQRANVTDSYLSVAHGAIRLGDFALAERELEHAEAAETSAPDAEGIAAARQRLEESRARTKAKR